MEKQYFGYIRVSTAKQGEKGVSLQEQKGAIQQYAQRFGLSIVQWFEERESAAKRGRPVFTLMMKGLRSGNVRGLIVHKIDRSARNLKDWADLGELIQETAVPFPRTCSRNAGNRRRFYLWWQDVHFREQPRTRVAKRGCVYQRENIRKRERRRGAEKTNG